MVNLSGNGCSRQEHHYFSELFNGNQAKKMIEFLASPDPSPYPFSPAVRVGNLLYVSGQVGMQKETGILAPGGVEAETRQALENMRVILERSGSSMERVVKCTVMLTDINDFPKMNAVYARFFPGPKPARSTFGVAGLFGGPVVEIECIAEAD